MEDIEELEQEVKVLKKRIEILERAENNRKISKYLSIIIKLVIIFVIAFSAYQGYNYVVNKLPELVENKIKDTIGIKR